MAADQEHECGDERDGEQENEGRQTIEPGNGAADDRGHDERERQLRQIPRHVGVGRLDARGHVAGEGAGRLRGGEGRSGGIQTPDCVTPQTDADSRRRLRSADIRLPREAGSREGQDRKRHQVARDRRERPLAEKHRVDRQRQDPGLAHHHLRIDGAEADGQEQRLAFRPARRQEQRLEADR